MYSAAEVAAVFSLIRRCCGDMEGTGLSHLDSLDKVEASVFNFISKTKKQAKISNFFFTQIKRSVASAKQCVCDRHPRASQLTTAPQLKASADGIAVACSAPDHEAAAAAVPVPGLIVDLVTVVCGLSVSTCDEAPRAFTMATRGPYRTLDLATKVKILKEVEQGGTAKQDIAQKYGIKPNTLSNILKNKRSVLDAFENDQFKMSRKRMRTGAHPELEHALLIWIREARSNRLPLSGDIVAAKASSLAIMLGIENFASSDGWLTRFKQRHDMVFKSVNGKRAAVNAATLGEEDTSELDVDGLLPALGDVPFEEYVATDSSVETCGALSDAEIVEMVRPSEPSHETEVDDDDAASEPLPRAADVAAGLALAQRFFTAESNAEEALRHIYSLQDLLSAARFSKQKQTAITDFFS
ncbi:hypothetical protein HPB52_020892 [Rhipicephalus sanguineus]|uniref:Tick transposon n=1 Tax=Rhipicephalus sanguineus TaxID=34632 RepID=A0A9D4YQP1_RHISA|nr:hypothetical protein HPB52_020892 [Rhipicephalus sanguineus]